MTKAELNIRAALDIAMNHGGSDGDRRLVWVIDQMVRALCGSAAEYRQWVKAHNVGEHGPETYSWDIGIAP